MILATTPRRHRTDDRLRVLGLSRIARCAPCERFRALRDRVEVGHPGAGEPPRVPSTCREPVCAPLVRRYFDGA